MLLFAALCIVAAVAARVVFPKEVREELHEELEELREHSHHDHHHSEHPSAPEQTPGGDGKEE
jgi:UDP-GlcNAc:undecaprenyl-phosphate GlcNAc-1-phosphate transferase